MFIKPVDLAILSVIPEGDPDLNTYLNELPITNKPEQQSKTFWFPTPDNPGRIEDGTPIQTRILKELSELKEKKNWIRKTTKNPEKIFLENLMGPIHC